MPLQILGTQLQLIKLLKRSERKFSGQQQQMAIYLEEPESLRPVRFDHFIDLEQFTDILDETIINLKENGNCGELGDGYKRSCQR